jgi:mRNA interferase MazF
VVRGSVIWVALDPALGVEVPKTRPCVVVSRAIANTATGTVTVVPLSSMRGRQSDRLVQPILRARDSGLSKDSRALCDQIRTIDRGRLRATVGTLRQDVMRKIDRALVLHLNLEDYVVS